MEANMQVLEGAQCRVRVKLTNEAGEQLSPELFLVYAGAFCPGYAPAHFHAERTAEEWVLTMPGLKPGRVPWNWQVFAAEYATGVEWLLAAGEVNVMERYAGCSGYVDPDEMDIVATLDKTTMQMTVQIGDSTAACSLAVVTAQNSAKEAANRAEQAAEQAQAAETARTQAGGSATNAAESAEKAREQATAADTSATDAANSASAAAASSKAAAEEVTKAAAEVKKAKLERETAAGHAAAAAQSAQAAMSNQQGAEQAAQDADQARVAAETAKAAADAAKIAAQTSESNANASAAAAAADKAAAEKAKNDAQEAQSKAEAESAKAEEKAALLGDAALKSANNVFSGANVFNGAISGNGTLLGVPFWQWMGLSSIFSQFDLTPSEFKALFPEWQTAAVWPYVRLHNMDGDTITMGNTPTTGTRFAFFEVNTTKKNWHEPYVDGVCEEMWLYIKGKPWVADYLMRGLNNFVIAPEWDSEYGINVWIDLRGYKEKTLRTTLYTPKLKICSLGSRYDFNKTVTHEVTFACYPTPYEKLYVKGPLSFRLVNANFQNCKLVSVNNTAYLDRESILSILNTLPAYDAETMTTVPTCTMFVDPELEGDEEIVNALLNLQTSVEEGGAGWTVAVSGISLTGAATYGLRPTVYCKRWPESSGCYVDADGVRWEVSSGTIALRHGEANEQLGYEAFASVEEALTAWGLVEYVAPVPEGMERPSPAEN